MDVSVRVTNLAQFSKALKQVDRNLVDDLKSEFRAIVAPIAAEVRGKVPRLSGAASGSVTTRATMRGAAIVAGGTKAPYFQWLDFGGAVGRNRSIKRDWKGPTGRYVYTTIKAHAADTRLALGRAIAKAGHDAGFEVR